MFDSSLLGQKPSHLVSVASRCNVHLRPPGEPRIGWKPKLKEQVKTYRKLLQKISRLKTKILGALRDEGCVEAAELLQRPAKEPGATRCYKCVGCRTLAAEGPCHGCSACQGNTECEEHTRLCMTWSQPVTTFVAGSVSTGVSSLWNVIRLRSCQLQGTPGQTWRCQSGGGSCAGRVSCWIGQAY